MLSNVTILITAGGRPGYLEECLYGIDRNLHECKAIVVTDDKPEPFFLHNVLWRPMPPDTFLTKKRNAGVALIDTKYTLMAADDFEFDINSRATVIKMMNFLDDSVRADLVAGTVNGRPYAGYLDVRRPNYIKEHRVNMPLPVGEEFVSVDIAANFFLARTKTLQQIPWDETIGPIGGEHADWFLDLMTAEKRVYWNLCLNINEQEKDKTKEAPDYRERRARCQQGHELFLKKRGIKKYFGFDDEVQEIT